MPTIIYGVPVLADTALSWEQTNKIVTDLVQLWAWEGRQLGKIELICDKQWVHVCTYEKPSIRLIPLENKKSEE